MRRETKVLVAVNGSVERDGRRRRYGLTVPGPLHRPARRRRLDVRAVRRAVLPTPAQNLKVIQMNMTLAELTSRTGLTVLDTSNSPYGSPSWTASRPRAT
ncbi:hypothetical protein GCM10020220_101070 [Nonomuraea rubra]|uniref:hypothetical protein n=1 Tax=Nonomuraea rubra TaxID=46180 RepID=UPI0031EE2287